MSFNDSATAQVTGIVTLQDRFSGTLHGMQRGLSRLERYGGRAVSNMSRNFERMGIIAAGAAVLATKSVIESAANWEDAMKTVEKTLDATSKTPENLKAIGDGLLEMSKRLPVTATELADIAKQAGQLGIEGASDMLRFTETLAKLSKVTELEVGYAAENMGKLRTIFQMNADELDHFGNVLIALENSAASTVQEILNVTRRFAGAGQAAGLSADQVAAFASTITSLGIRPEAAGSSLSRLFQRTGIEIANGTKKAKEFAKFMKMNFGDMKKLFAEDPATFFQRFFKAVGMVSKAGSAMDKLNFKALMKQMGIVNVRDIDAVLKLGEGYEELARQMGVAEGASNELDEAARSRFSSFANQWVIFKNKVNAAAIEIGLQILPELIKGFESFADWMANNKGAITKFAQDVGTAFRDFMKNVTPENINKVVGILRSAAGWAQSLINAFMSMPDWAKQILIGAYVGNKLTGGVVADLVGELGKGLIKGILHMNAGVVNINAATVNGGGFGAGGKGGPGLLALLGMAGLAITIATAVEEGVKSFNTSTGSTFAGPSAPTGVMLINNMANAIVQGLKLLRPELFGPKPTPPGVTITPTSHTARKDDPWVRQWHHDKDKRVTLAVEKLKSQIGKDLSHTNTRVTKTNMSLAELKRKTEGVQNKVSRGNMSLAGIKRKAEGTETNTRIMARKKMQFSSNVSVNVRVDGKTVATAVYRSSNNYDSSPDNIRGGAS